MKYLISLLLIFVCISNASAANTATAQTAVPIRVAGCGKVTPVVVTIDTTSSDLTVYDPADSTYAAIVGIFAGEATAGNLTFKSGSTTLAVIEGAVVPDSLVVPVNGILVMAAKGQNLIFNSSVVRASMIVYVAECSSFIIN